MKERTATAIEATISGVMLFALLFIAMDANATGSKDPKVVIEQDQGQNQSQGQEQSQSQSQDASANNEGNTLTAEGDVVTVEGDTYDIPVSSAFAPPAYSHIRCDQILGIGATKDDGSMAVGIPMPRWMSRKIKDCQRVDNALWLESRGLLDEAIAHRCETKSMIQHYGDVDICTATIKAATNYQKEIDDLKGKLEFIDNERKIARQKCSESKQRIKDAWKDSCGK